MAELESSTLTTKRKRIMIYFVEATQKLIQSEGVDGLSIRKIANEAGYNSATIYNYFQDLEHLTLFGSVRYLRDYVTTLGPRLSPDMNALDRFRTVYDCFNDRAFRDPDIFHNMFFGRYSDSLDQVLHTYYYELFPEELEGLSPGLQTMLVTGSMRERDRYSVQRMVKEGFIAPEKADITLELVCMLIQHCLHSASIQGETLDVEAHKAYFRRMFDHILAAAR